MNFFPKKLQSLLDQRNAAHNIRTLSLPDQKLIDFCSNDYLGYSVDASLQKIKHTLLKSYQIKQNGSGGSRLISGNSVLHVACEDRIAAFHETEKALLFNSGYDANLGLLSAVPQRGDVVLYDELCHASILDGIRLSFATAYKFKHNDLQHLRELLLKNKSVENRYVVSESVFSMDGDCAPVKEIAALCKKEKAFLILDEAHALGVCGSDGKGLASNENIHQDCFARVYTYGKAMGGHGAAVVGSKTLYKYLLNFSRSFIFTTALPPSSAAAILASYTLLEEQKGLKKLQKNIHLFNQLSNSFSKKIPSHSAIHCFLIPGNEAVIQAADAVMRQGFYVKAIKSPTVKSGTERLRICLHANNKEKDIRQLARSLKTIL